MIKVLHFVSKMDMAGQETFIMNVFRHIDRSLFMFNFLCTDCSKGDYDFEIQNLGGKLFYLPELKKKKGLFKYIQQIQDISFWLKSNKSEYDVLHLHTYHALDVFVHLLAAKTAKVSKVIIHSHNTYGMHTSLHRIMRWINNTFFTYTKLACSQDAGRWLFGNENFTVVYNGVDIDFFKYDIAKRNHIRESLGIQDKIVFGNIGRFENQKNHKFLIDIFSEYHKTHLNSVLILIGKGSLEGDIRELVRIKKVEDSVLFIGTVHNVHEYLSAFDCFLFPSLYEGLSVVLVEAQINGLPILCNENISKETIISDRINGLPIIFSEEWVNYLDMNNFERTSNINASRFDLNVVTKVVSNIYMSE